MSSGKQIEEITKFFMSLETYDHKECEDCGKWEHDRCDEYCFSKKVATDLYDAGYRKSSEMVMEIFEEIEESLHNLAQFYLSCDLRDNFGICYAIYEQAVLPIKKKRTEDKT